MQAVSLRAFRPVSPDSRTRTVRSVVLRHVFVRSVIYICGNVAVLEWMMSTSEQQLAIPDEIASPQAKLVYLALLVTEQATASEIQQLLDLSKLTILPILRSLTANDHIERTEDGYVV